MSSGARTRLLAGFAVVVVLTACAPATSPTAGPSATASGGPGQVNIARQAALVDAFRLEVYESGEHGFLLRGTLVDPVAVAAIVEVLDRPVELGPRVRCPDRYHLHFVSPDGGRAILGLVCGDRPEAIRGAQAFWGNQDAKVPREVGDLLTGAIDRLPAVEPGLADAVVQQAVNELARATPDLQAYVVQDWRRVRVVAQPPLLGAEHWLYVSPEWVVDVRWPVVPDPTFELLVAVPSAGFSTSGRLAAGGVFQQP